MEKLKSLLSTSLLLMLCFMFAACSSDLDPNDDIIQEPTGIVQGHEYVDLGLSVYWATCNVGANSPEDFGGYYAWGETEEKSDYSEDTYKYAVDSDRNGSYNFWEEWISIGSNISGTQYDVAHVKWGGTWRMPTLNEIKELMYNCSWKWTKYNGVKGQLVTGRNGNSIFLPAAGGRPGTSVDEVGSLGYYWSATEHSSDYHMVYGLGFSNDGCWWDHSSYWTHSYIGHTVRPVTKNMEVENTPDNELKNIIAGDWYAFAYDERFVDVVSFSEDRSYKAHEYNAEGNVTVDDNGNVDADWIRDYGKFNGSWKITGDNLFLQEDGKGGRDGNSYSCLVEINPGKIQSVEENKFVVKYIIKAKDMNGEVLEFEYLTTFIRLGSSGSNDENEKPEESDKTTGEIQGHEWVDLGLSVKWATCNVGAESPEDYGDYYAWGETTTKSDYDWDTYKWCEGTKNSMTKYCTNSDYGIVDNRKRLASSEDVATVKWGNKWRMPTKEEFHELVEDCTWTWTPLGVNGMKVTGPNGNSIFLPAAGRCGGTGSPLSRGSVCFYWSASLSEYYCYHAYHLCCDNDRYDWNYVNNRYFGCPVRPVTD